MLMWIFGNVKEQEVLFHTTDKAAGNLKLEKANVHWQLSIDLNDLPAITRSEGKRTFRSLTIDGDAFEFS
jgi:UDP-N-acetyl-2-amino-2-deoxyglucuronate dehydrogenase